jgi:endoglucanase
MYIDIGAKSREEAGKHVSVGDCAVFDSEFVTFGKDGCSMKGKALDDRAGCALLVEIMRSLYRNPCNMPFDVYFAFTGCEEVGISGANVAAFGVKPDVAVILEATGVNDLPGAGRDFVSKQGEGGTLSICDRGTIYDMGFINYARQTAEDKGLKVQLKQAFTGGTDAAHIQRSLTGIRVLGLSLPTRYIHSASCVARVEDYEQTRELVIAMLRDWKLD